MEKRGYIENRIVKEEKKQLAEITSLSEKQITTWLINARQKNKINKKNEFE